MDYKTVKVPGWVYDNARVAQAEVLNRGFEAVPVGLREPPHCPVCASAVRHLTVGYQHIECTSCGYQQQTLAASGSNLATVGIGFLLGLGVAALLGGLSGSQSPARAKASAAAGRMRRGTARASKKQIDGEIRRVRARRAR